MPPWHVAASGEGSLICQKSHKRSVSFQHRRPPEALRAALVIPPRYTRANFPESTGEESLKQRGRAGIRRDLASNDRYPKRAEG